jgi:hypothetical protein
LVPSKQVLIWLQLKAKDNHASRWRTPFWRNAVTGEWLDGQDFVGDADESQIKKTTKACPAR